jgi:hypothetical protein
MRVGHPVPLKSPRQYEKSRLTLARHTDALIATETDVGQRIAA